MADVITDLLPRGSTTLEKNLGRVLLQRLDLNAEQIKGLKFNPPEGWLDYLIDEYALGEISPYFSDKRQLIRAGISWTRIRGTPAALQQALGWVGQGGAEILESPPSAEPRPGATDYQPYAHWAEYQLRLEQLPTAATIAALTAVARLAAPTRSRLWRLIYGCNREVFCLDGTALGGDLLSDDSGFFQANLGPGTPKLSFCQHFAHWAAREDTPTAHCAITVIYSSWVSRDEYDQLYLDDVAPLFEVYSAINTDAQPRTAVAYQGQIWTDARWADADSWQTTRAIVRSNWNIDDD